MTRYYRLVITDPKSKKIYVPNFSGKPGFSLQPADPNLSTYCSLNTGANVNTIGGSNPAAQTVELDIPIAALHEPVGNAYFRVWGISLQEIGQAANLNGAHFQLFAGMAKGLPLANPSQAGLIAEGLILQAFGNWVGINRTLDLYVQAGGSSPTSDQTTGNTNVLGTVAVPATNARPANLIWQWQQGQPFLNTIANTLKMTFPTHTIKGAVDEMLAWTSEAAEVAYFATLPQFAQYIRNLSLKIIGGYAPNRKLYAGVRLTLQGGNITISDGSTQTTPKQIAYVDLIGQPTWANVGGQVQCTVTMRADILVGSFVTLPPGQNTIKAGSMSQYTQGPTAAVFSSTFLVASVRHVGNSRDAGSADSAGQSWVTVLDLIQTAAPATNAPSTLPTIYKPSTAATT
jgi:hypothetical protein